MPYTLEPEIRRAVVRDIVRLAGEKYVFPDAGREIARHIQDKLEQGDYEAITDADLLAITLTEDLQAASKDRHWSVVYDPRRSPANVDTETEEEQAQLARWLALAPRRNFGFEKVERLKGNVGYIDLREFAPAEYAGETAVAAMGFVANCDALLFDLRQNHGGNPSMVQLLTSYLFDPEPRHINTLYYRPSDGTQQFWTFPHVPGKRLPEVPVYVLTSKATGSGAEEFAYNLKHMERATLVGETTVGAAHPYMMAIVQEQFQVRLPYGRPINPITKENWEGTGVEPHIAVPQEEALKTAHLHALARLTEVGADDQQRRDLAWEAEIVESLYAPPTVGQATLARYAGHYGQRCFVVEDVGLTYAHQAYPVAWRLEPLTETRFRLDDDIKFEFIVDEQGRASAVMIAYRDGRPVTTVARSG
jgi:C-terminal processing protease CtpA/Prc